MNEPLHQKCRFHLPVLVRTSPSKLPATGLPATGLPATGLPATGLPATVLMLLCLWLTAAAHGDFDSQENSQPQAQPPAADAPATHPEKTAAPPQSQGSGKSASPGKADQAAAGKRPKKKNK